MQHNFQQLTSTVVMIRPDYFGFNTQTAETNVFQVNVNGLSEKQIRDAALQEFENMVEILTQNEIEVITLSSRTDIPTPDAVFPNNWFSHHDNDLIILYPMLTANRRAERQTDALLQILEENGSQQQKVIDLSLDEIEGNILEGTGSMVLDRQHKVSFAMESPRTSKSEFEKWCQLMGYEGIFFHAYDEKDLPIYHTNVIMSVGEEFVVACTDSIKKQEEKKILEKKFKDLGKKIIPITLQQVSQMCGNILQLRTKNGKKKIIMSENARNGFTPEQRQLLESFGEVVSVDISTIEKIGGGSARCMMAEVFKN